MDVQRARRGYRAGGLNPQAYNCGMEYGPETVTDFEAGLKTDFTAGGMNGRFNFAAFYSIQKDAQISQPFSTISASGTRSRTQKKQQRNITTAIAHRTPTPS